MQSGKKITGMKNKNRNKKPYDGRTVKRERIYQGSRRSKYTASQQKIERVKKEMSENEELNGEYIPVDEINSPLYPCIDWDRLKDATKLYRFPLRYMGMYEHIKPIKTFPLNVFSYPRILVKALEDPLYYMEKHYKAFHERFLTHIETTELNTALMAYRIFVTKELDFLEAIPDRIDLACYNACLRKSVQQSIDDRIDTVKYATTLMLLIGGSLSTGINRSTILKGILGVSLTKMVCAKTEKVLPSDLIRQKPRNTEYLIHALSPLKIF